MSSRSPTKDKAYLQLQLPNYSKIGFNVEWASHAVWHCVKHMVIPNQKYAWCAYAHGYRRCQHVAHALVSAFYSPNVIREYAPFVSDKLISNNVEYTSSQIPQQTQTALYVAWRLKIWRHVWPPCFSPDVQLWPWLVASQRASKRDVGSSAQRIQWNPSNGTPGAGRQGTSLLCVMHSGLANDQNTAKTVNACRSLNTAVRCCCLCAYPPKMWAVLA